MLSSRRGLVAFVLFLSSICYGPSAFAVDFADPVQYPVGTPSGVVLADFDGDGNLDLAVTNGGAGNVSIFLGNGDGTFQAATSFDAGVSPAALSKGDFNNDGKPDLAVFQPGDTNTLASGAMSVLLGKGDGSFQSPKITMLTVATDLAVADFDLDHKADVAVADYDSSSGNIRVLTLTGNGDGTFQSAKQSAIVQSTISGGEDIRYLAAADFDNDAKPDLAVQVSGGVRVLLGGGDGTFQAGPVATVTSGFVVLGVQGAEDINGDGKMDLIVHSMFFSRTGSGESGSSRRTDHISVFLGNGNGTLQPEQIAASSFWRKSNVFAPPVGDSINSPVFADYNGDGVLDLALWRTTFAGTVHTSQGFEIDLGKADGTFSNARISFPYSTNAARIGATADLNGDQLGDLIVSDLLNNAAVVVLNASPASGADLGIIAAAAGPEPVGIGTNLTYTADVLNEGPGAASTVAFTDTLPSNVTFVSATATQGSCTRLNLVVTCNIGSLASAFDAMVTIVVTPTALGTITNTMSVSATESDLAPANNSATQESTVVRQFTLTVATSGTGSGTVTSNPARINCPGACSALFNEGTVVALTATAAGDSTFTNWGGACSGTDACSVTMNSDQSVTATFAVNPDFSLSAAAASPTSVAAGHSATSTVTINSANGFNSEVQFVCSIDPLPLLAPACSLSPTSATPAANGSATSTLTITTTAPTAALAAPVAGGWLYALWLPIVGMAWAGMGLAPKIARKRILAAVTLCFALAGGTLFQVACGGSMPPHTTGGTPPGTYTVTVTGTSVSTQHSTNVMITVN
jgi:uncharacterized repeat protein (TIGR01451 family)